MGGACGGGGGGGGGRWGWTRELKREGQGRVRPTVRKEGFPSFKPQVLT